MWNNKCVFVGSCLSLLLPAAVYYAYLELSKCKKRNSDKNYIRKLDAEGKELLLVHMVGFLLIHYSSVYNVYTLLVGKLSLKEKIFSVKYKL